MRRPSYAVVSYTLLTLSVFGFMVNSVRTKIPPPEPNRLRYETQEYLVQGSRSRVDWRTLGPEVFSEARRSGKPIMIVVGAPWSKTARDADVYTFSDKDVVSFLNRYMICVRIDGQAEPHWLGAFLPIRRVQTPMTVGFQVWFLTPEGELFDNGGEAGTVIPLDAYNFTGLLVRARERLREIRTGGPEAPTPGHLQRGDRQYLVEPSFPVAFDEGAILQEIEREGGLARGGVLRFRRVRPLPNVIQYLVMTGQTEAAQRAVAALLTSPLVDWLDGGLYRSYSPTNPPTLEFDKAAQSNAEWMSILAKSSDVMPDKTLQSFAVGIFKMLSGPQFVHHGFVAGCQVGDEGHLSRSRRQSFTPKMLREILTPEERVIAQEQLGLKVETNRTMSVWMRNPPAAFEPESEAAKVLEKLRASRKMRPEVAGRRQLDIHGYVVARLLECARLWNDSEKLLIADDLYSRMDWFLAGDDVKHTLESGVPDTPFLGDYLAYADASLQHFLAFGRADSIEKGFKVLRRARALFESETPGVWRTAIPREGVLGPKDTDVPEVLDLVRESCTGMAIRLCNTYGRLLRDATALSVAHQSDALLLLQTAQSTVGQNSAVSQEIGLEGAGLLCSVLKVQDDRHALVVGKDAVGIANLLAKKIPRRLVAPAIGPVRPAMQQKPPGIYVITEGNAQGPLSESEALQLLRGPFRR